MLTDSVGQDLPVAGFKGIAVVMFHTMPFWSSARAPQVRWPWGEFRAGNEQIEKRSTTARFSRNISVYIADAS